MSVDGPRNPPGGRFDGPRFAEALSRVRDALSKSPPPAAAGYRMFWISGRDVGWFDLPAGGAYAIVGSHDQCDVVLRHDGRIALRHLLATTIALADGLALRLLDLQTGVPFYLSDGIPRRSIVASGPLVAELGRFVIGGVPATDDGKLELFEAAPLVALEESVALPLSIRPPATLMGPPRADRGPISYVTSMPPPSSIAAVALPHVAPDNENDARDDRAPEGASGIDAPSAQVTLRLGDHEATVALGREALEAGVLIGRLPNCHDPRLLAILNGGISRGHVLLFRHHDACEAFDLCSTQGTFLGTKRVRRVRLSPEGTTLALASVEPVALEWKEL